LTVNPGNNRELYVTIRKSIARDGSRGMTARDRIRADSCLELPQSYPLLTKR
jgi:hypothetical protein